VGAATEHFCADPSSVFGFDLTDNGRAPIPTSEAAADSRQRFGTYAPHQGG